MASVLELNLASKYEGRVPTINEAYLLAGQYVYLTSKDIKPEFFDSIKTTVTSKRFVDFLVKNYTLSNHFEVPEAFLESILLLLIENNGMAVFKKKELDLDCLLYFPTRINNLQKLLREMNLL